MKLSNDRTLGEVIRDLLQEYTLDGRINEIKVINSWEKVAGKMITKHTKGLNIKNKKLFVQIDSPALRNELSYSREKITDALNAEAGLHVIDDVVFV